MYRNISSLADKKKKKKFKLQKKINEIFIYTDQINTKLKLLLSEQLKSLIRKSFIRHSYLCFLVNNIKIDHKHPACYQKLNLKSVYVVN